MNSSWFWPARWLLPSNSQSTTRPRSSPTRPSQTPLGKQISPRAGTLISKSRALCLPSARPASASHSTSPRAMALPSLSTGMVSLSVSLYCACLCSSGTSLQLFGNTTAEATFSLALDGASVSPNNTNNTPNLLAFLDGLPPSDHVLVLTAFNPSPSSGSLVVFDKAVITDLPPQNSSE